MSAHLRTLRPGHWVKNLLLAFPVVAAHRPLTMPLVLTLLQAMLAFSVVASALYIFNDAVDLRADRMHPIRGNRPLASGAVSPASAGVLAFGCLVGGGALARGLTPAFHSVLIGYAVLNASYTLLFKRIAVVDVVILTGLYVLRLLAGAVVVGIQLSEWFIGFFAFLFFSLAVLKRVGELKIVIRTGIGEDLGKAYSPQDLALLTVVGPTAAIAAALVYALYLGSPEVRGLYERPRLLWLGLPLILIWSLRLWTLGIRGEVGEDPVLFVTKQPASYLVLGLLLAVVVGAS